MAINFSSLPADAYLEIMERLDNTKDLYHLIAASPQCFQAFVPRRRAVLSSIVANALPSDILHHAVASTMIKSPTNRLNYEHNVRFIEDTYLEMEEPISDSEDDAGSHILPLPTSDLSRLCTVVRLCDQARQLCDTFYKNMLPNITEFTDKFLDDGDEDERLRWLEREASQPLSLDERMRLMRAFLRYELFCRAVPQDWDESAWHAYNMDAEVDEDDLYECFTLDAFCKLLRPHEAEELRGAYFFILRSTNKAFCELDNTWVTLLRDLGKVNLEDIELDDSTEMEEVVKFPSMFDHRHQDFQPSLFAYTEKAWRTRAAQAHAFSLLGLQCIGKMLRTESEGLDRYDFIRSHRHLIYKTIRGARGHVYLPALRDADDVEQRVYPDRESEVLDHRTEPSQGTEELVDHFSTLGDTYGDYERSLSSDTVEQPFRELGLAFWNSKRFTRIMRLIKCEGDGMWFFRGLIEEYDFFQEKLDEYLDELPLEKETTVYRPTPVAFRVRHQKNTEWKAVSDEWSQWREDNEGSPLSYPDWKSTVSKEYRQVEWIKKSDFQELEAVLGDIIYPEGREKAKGSVSADADGHHGQLPDLSTCTCPMHQRFKYTA